MKYIYQNNAVGSSIEELKSAFSKETQETTAPFKEGAEVAADIVSNPYDKLVKPAVDNVSTLASGTTGIVKRLTPDIANTTKLAA